MKPREITNQILEMIEQGILEKDAVITACLSYMSEADVADMAHINEFLPEEDDYDGQPDDAQEWHDFDPDC
jgi:hypothetical protein